MGFLLSLFFVYSASAELSLIYIFHEDGNYTYHDEINRPRTYVSDKLHEALTVSQACPRCEVFLFRQRGRSFSHTPGGAFLFKNGQMQIMSAYAYHENEFLMNESRFYRQHSRVFKGEKLPQIVFYFGKQIPTPYDSGLGIRVEKIDFFRGLVRLITTDRLALLVLSTCKNGNTEDLVFFSGVSDRVIGAKDNINLAMLDTRVDPTKKPEDISRDILHNSFEKLKITTPAAVTLQLYDRSSQRFEALYKAHRFTEPAQK